MSKLFPRSVPVVVLLTPAVMVHAQQTALFGARQRQTPQGSATPSFGSVNQRSYNGESDQAVVHNVSGGRITEIRCGKQVFGHALCGY
jgi:hypothetical protein